MKKLFTIITSALIYTAVVASPNQTFNKLAEVNKCWHEQKGELNLPAYTTKTETEWIQLHLSLAERILRSKSTAHLTKQQTQNRLAALDHLNQYWKQAAFPQNEDYAIRLPIFIDKHDNFCAVGYLLKATGYEAVSRKISANTNLAYVREMNYEELPAWANKYGFTVDELAWIQPAYPPVSTFKTVGKGTNGAINDIATDDANSCFYVAGAFSKADSTLNVSNVAKVTEQNGNYTWSALGAGTDGEVKAIAIFNGKVFVGGDFMKAGNLNSAYAAIWNGTQWQSATNGLTGRVTSFTQLGNTLYATGPCDMCLVPNTHSIVYKWSGTEWVNIEMVEGSFNKVRTLLNSNGQEQGTYVAGKFKLNGSSCNINVAKVEGDSLVELANCPYNEVFDIAWHNGKLTMAGNLKQDSAMAIKVLENNQWTNITGDPQRFEQLNYDVNYRINALFSKNNVLVTGGRYTFDMMVGTISSNFIAFDPQGYSQNEAYLDSQVNCIAYFKNRLLLGGNFTQSYSNMNPNGVNRIAVKDNLPTITTPSAISQVNEFSAKIYPNPVVTNAPIQIVTDEDLNHVTIADATGKIVLAKSVEGKQISVSLTGYAPGIYFVNGTTVAGKKFNGRILVR